METNDFLMKKWCFGFGRRRNTKEREQAHMNADGELTTHRTYPKYRTIVFKVEKATNKGKTWTVEGTQWASLTGKPKKTKLVLKERNGLLYAKGQKKPFFRIQTPVAVTDEGMPPVGSLITVNKKHAIVTEVGRNQLTVFTDGQIKTVVCKPGTIRWNDDKVLLSAVEGK
jgi:hypothetical protein